MTTSATAALMPQAILFVIDGAKALAEAIREVFGDQALLHAPAPQGAQRPRPPPRDQTGPGVRAGSSAAWANPDPELAEPA